MLDAAYAAGVRYVDAARSYGLAEAFLGTWLRARTLSPDALTIGSKWGYTYVGGGGSMLGPRDEGPVGRRRCAARSSKAGHCLVNDFGFIKSTPPRSKAASSKMGACSTNSVACAPKGSPSGHRDRTRTSRCHPPRVGCEHEAREPVPGCSGDVEPARAVGRARVGRGQGLGLGVIVKEAVANGRLTDRNSSVEHRV